MPRTHYGDGTTTRSGDITRDRFAAALVKQVKSKKRTNITAAAVEAGLAPVSASAEGSKLLKDPKVQARLRKAMGTEEILWRLKRIGRGKLPSKVVREKGMAVDSQGNATPVEKVREEFDSKGALDSLAKIGGLLRDGSPPASTTTVNVLALLGAVPQDKLDELIQAHAGEQHD